MFQAVVVPHRSLSPLGLKILLGCIAGAVSVTASVFVWLGAWPVVGFSGLEVGLAALLLRINARAVRSSEMLVLTGEALVITRTDVQGRKTEVRLEPTWLRVHLEDRPGRVPRLSLRSFGRETEIAAQLGEEPKRDLARALEEALAGWRSPRFDTPQLAD